MYVLKFSYKESAETNQVVCLSSLVLRQFFSHKLLLSIHNSITKSLYVEYSSHLEYPRCSSVAIDSEREYAIDNC